MNIWAGLIIALALASVGCALVLVALVRWLGAIIEGRRPPGSQYCGGVNLIGTGGERHRFEMARSLPDPIRIRGAVIRGWSRRADHTSTASRSLGSFSMRRRGQQHLTT